MSHKTPFAGLTALSPNDNPNVDGGAVFGRNQDLIDYFLEIGAVTHRHDDHPALPAPIPAPAASAISGSGTIKSGIPIYLGYTLVDTDGGETLISSLTTITTRDPIQAPTSPITGVASYSSGALQADTFYYALTLTDGLGGETAIGPVLSIDRQPGSPFGSITMFGLASDLVSHGATGWRLYKSVGGQALGFLAAGSGDAFVDDGSGCVDCGQAPPNVNKTNSSNSIRVLVGSGASAGASSGAAAFRLYASQDGTFSGPSLLGQYAPGSAATPLTFSSLNLLNGSPPDVATAIRGARRISIDELGNNYWRSAVANFASLPAAQLVGEMRMALDTRTIYISYPGLGAAGGAGWQVLTTPGSGIAVGGAGMASGYYGRTAISFTADGASVVSVSDLGGGSARVNIHSDVAPVPTIGLTVGGNGTTPADTNYIAQSVTLLPSGNVRMVPLGVGAGSAFVRVVGLGPAVGGSALGGGSGLSPLFDARTAISFVGSGLASVSVQNQGGGSAQVLVSVPTGAASLAIGGSAIGGSVITPLLLARGAVSFIGSGAAVVGVADLGGGSAQVAVTVPQPTITIADFLGTTLGGRQEITFVGSGGIGASVIDLGGGSAAVLFGSSGTPPILGGSANSQQAFFARTTPGSGIPVPQNGPWLTSRLPLPFVDFDSTGCYDPVQSRFTPTTPGVYFFQAGILRSGGPVNTNVVEIRRNGLALPLARYNTGSTPADAPTPYLIQTATYLNGAGDYVEAGAIGPVGETLAGATFSGFLVGGAQGPAGPALLIGASGVPPQTAYQVSFAGSGGTNVAVQDLGGGSANVLVSTNVPPRLTVGASGFVSSVASVGALEFVASGGSIDILDTGGGSARVTLTAMPGPPGATGPIGGSAGSITIGGSGLVPEFDAISSIQYIGLGASQVSLDGGGGSARVFVSTPRAVYSASAGASAMAFNPLSFAGSGGATVTVQDLGGGSGQVLVTTPVSTVVSDGLQGGVLGATDGLVNTLGVSGAGNITANLQGGVCWVPDGTGALVRCSIPVGSIVLTPGSLPANTRFAVVGIDIVPPSGITPASLAASTKGTDQTTQALALANPPAVALGRVRLVDVVIQNSTGAMSLSAARDRRPWARGAFNRIVRNSNAASGNDYVITTVVDFIDAANLTARIECSGVPVRMRLVGRLFAGPNSGNLIPTVDGNPVDGMTNGSSTFNVTPVTGTGEASYSCDWIVIPAPGSHTFSWKAFTASSTMTLRAQATIPLQMIVEEIIRQNTNNN